jgi:hypothetical protein
MGPRCGPDWQFARDDWLRDMERRNRAQQLWLWALWLVIVTLNVALVVVFVASLDPALIAMAGGLAANLIIMLFQVWIARRSEAGRGQPRR